MAVRRGRSGCSRRREAVARVGCSPAFLSVLLSEFEANFSPRSVSLCRDLEDFTECAAVDLVCCACAVSCVWLRTGLTEPREKGSLELVSLFGGRQDDTLLVLAFFYFISFIYFLSLCCSKGIFCSEVTVFH